MYVFGICVSSQASGICSGSQRQDKNKEEEEEEEEE